jgi:hypothetical protein
MEPDQILNNTPAGFAILRRAGPFSRLANELARQVLPDQITQLRQGEFCRRIGRGVIKQPNLQPGVVGKPLAVCAGARCRAKSHLPVPVNSGIKLSATMIASHYEWTFQVLAGRFRAGIAACSAL